VDDGVGELSAGARPPHDLPEGREDVGAQAAGAIEERRELVGRYAEERGHARAVGVLAVVDGEGLPERLGDAIERVDDQPALFGLDGAEERRAGDDVGGVRAGADEGAGEAPAPHVHVHDSLSTFAASPRSSRT
jgi:hypothetical protein